MLKTIVYILGGTGALVAVVMTVVAFYWVYEELHTWRERAFFFFVLIIFACLVAVPYV